LRNKTSSDLDLINYKTKKNMKNKPTLLSKRFFLYLLILGLIHISASSQETNAQKKKTTFLLEAYVLFPNMNGVTGVGTLPDVEVDADPGDIFEKLNMGAMIYFEVGVDRWAFATDIIYMDLKQGVKSGPIVQNGEVHAKQLAWEEAAMYRFLPRLEGGLGLRLNSMDMSIDMTRNAAGGGSVFLSRSAGETWVDPIMIVRFKSDPNSKFIYMFRGDIGGFGIGSDFAWQVQAYAGYRFSKLFQLTGGYRAIGMDFEKGSGNDRFMYNIDTFGPVIRFGFNF
jgi:hypothetical protein